MKGILEFELPMEDEQFNLHCKAMDYAICIDEIDEYLRAQLKYTERPEVELKVIQEVRDKLCELRIARDISP